MSAVSRMIDVVPVWSTRRQGDPTSIGHRMVGDEHGRPGLPVCGGSTHGLWFRRDVTWERVPEPQRCRSCAGEPLGAGHEVLELA